jgi:hypothetical protein
MSYLDGCLTKIAQVVLSFHPKPLAPGAVLVKKTNPKTVGISKQCIGE